MEQSTQMQGQICLITGVTSGIGKATVLGLAKMGATVLLVGRNARQGEIVRQEISRSSQNPAIDFLQADLSSQKSIHELARSVQDKYQQLHVLINNAGVFLLRRQETVDNIEMTLAVNLLAPFLLTNLLLDTLKSSAPARIINVSSETQANGVIQLDDLQSRQGYRMMRAYAQSKLGLVLISNKLARDLEGTGVTVNSLHPGFVATGIGQRGLGSLGRTIAQFFLARAGAITPEEGARTSLYLASSPEVKDITGQYFDKCQPLPSAPASYDPVLQEQLWEKCAELVHLT